MLNKETYFHKVNTVLQRLVKMIKIKLNVCLHFCIPIPCHSSLRKGIILNIANNLSKLEKLFYSFNFIFYLLLLTNSFPLPVLIRDARSKW